MLTISTGIQGQNPLILCAVDGNANIFNQSYLSRGVQGGQDAARDLTKAIAEFLSQEDVQVFGRLSFWISIFFNRGKLLDMLLGSDICTAEQFSAFLIGFSQASPRFLMVDAGPGQDAVNLKVRGEKFIWIAPFRAMWWANDRVLSQNTCKHTLGSLRPYGCFSEVRIVLLSKWPP